MEELIKMISEKTGISEGQSHEAIDMVVNYLKDKMPGGMGEKVNAFLNNDETMVSEDSNTVGEFVQNVKEKIGDMFGK